MFIRPHPAWLRIFGASPTGSNPCATLSRSIGSETPKAPTLNWVSKELNNYKLTNLGLFEQQTHRKLSQGFKSPSGSASVLLESRLYDHA